MPSSLSVERKPTGGRRREREEGERKDREGGERERGSRERGVKNGVRGGRTGWREKIGRSRERRGKVRGISDTHLGT